MADTAVAAQQPKKRKGWYYGGRKPGAKNKFSKASIVELAKTAVTPLEFMLSVMNSKKNPLPMRLEAARSAAPYVHPKLAQVSHTGSINSELNVKLSDETRLDIARRVAFILQGGVKALEALTPTEVIDDVTGDDDDGGGDT